VFIVSVIVSKVTLMLQFLHQMFNLFALLRDDKPVTPLTNGAIDETLQHFAPLSDDNCLLQLVDCLELSMSIDHLLKCTQNHAMDWTQVRTVWGPQGHMWGSMNVTSHAAGTSVFLAVCDGVPSCCSHPCKMPALLLQDVTVTLDNNWHNKHVVPC